MPGFNGINCTEKCPFPTYGKRCQMLCKCNKDQCDASTGCSSNFDGIPFFIRNVVSIHLYLYCLHV